MQSLRKNFLKVTSRTWLVLAENFIWNFDTVEAGEVVSMQSLRKGLKMPMQTRKLQNLGVFRRGELG